MTEDVERALEASSTRIADVNAQAIQALEIRINGLVVPPALVQLLVNGRWRTPGDPAKLRKQFPDGLTLYSFDFLLRENSHWMQVTDLPGDMSPRQFLLIGDLGHGTDQPLALDYRETASAPTVVFLEHTPNSHWKRIAPTIEAFAEQIGIV
jgi:hypothetical protein